MQTLHITKLYYNIIINFLLGAVRKLLLLYYIVFIILIGRGFFRISAQPPSWFPRLAVYICKTWYRVIYRVVPRYFTQVYFAGSTIFSMIYGFDTSSNDFLNEGI